MGGAPPITLEQFAALIAPEIASFLKIIREAGKRDDDGPGSGQRVARLLVQL